MALERRNVSWLKLAGRQVLNNLLLPICCKKAGCVSAKAEDHIKFARQFINLGFDHLVFHSARQDQQAFLEAYSRDVVSHLHEPAVATR
jgi:hypothetical protein